MRLLNPVIRILVSHMNNLRDKFTTGNTIATQFISHDLSGFSTVTTQQSLEEPLCSSPITPSLEKYINDVAIPINRAPQVMLSAIDLYKVFINVEGVSVALMSSLQSTGVFGSELDAPESDGLMADYDASLS